ncbi:MAG TPA: zinc ribbon domain-containing protein [Candidatus Limnocylindrales bacterium]
MDQILAQIGDAIASIFSSPVLQFGLRAIGIYLVILWLASAYWAFRDMQQRSDNAILPYLVAAGIILFTPLFFVLAVWVYKIVRPHEKIGEVWERNLAEEALLAEVEAIHHCPTCERRIDDEWIICPTCRTRLNRVCPNCSRLVGLDWSLCAWCGKDFERRPVAAASLEPLPGVREPAGRITDATADSGPRPTPTPTPAAPAVRTSVRSVTASRPSGSSRSTGAARTAGGVAPAQDPLPER